MSRRERSRGNNDDNYNDNDNNDDNEPIELELRGSKIVYFSNGIDILDPILLGLATHEVDQHCHFDDNNDDDNDVDDHDSVVIQLNADVQSEKAISVLTKIITHIEAHGLPPTSIVLPRSVAELLAKMERKKPDQAREIVRRLLPKTS
jgi:hypothetical protein